MPPTITSISSGTVAVLLVSHDGARWLPGVLAGLAEQTALPGTVVAVDTGSRDESSTYLDAAPQVGAVLRVEEGTSYPEAVRLGLERIDLSEDRPEWIWLLHDDSRPAPDALAALLASAETDADVVVLGPKLREWPSLRRLLEVGVTISGTGRRETGLERGEYDQGQHDEERDVLAVNTAGMLVRRDVLDELGGFDPALTIFDNDLDFGWRAAAAGHRTRVVPDAVVFHAEAARRGLRRTALTGTHTHREERRAALYTLLVNRSGRSLPFAVVRLIGGTLLRMLGFVLVRAPREALDDAAALVSVLAQPSRIREARRRRGRPGRPSARLARLLAPAWLPYRHGLDFVSDVVAATTNQAADVAQRRRAEAARRDPSSQAARRIAVDEDDELADDGAVARFFTNPVALALSLVVLVSLVSTRVAFGDVSGGALAPVPQAAGDWWRLHTESWHALGLGTAIPAPPIVLPLALLGSVLGATGAVTLLLVGAVPFALWGAWRFLRVVGRLASPAGAPRWLLLVASTAYAVLPAASGAWGEGRLGLVVATALLPWLAHAALGFVDPVPDRRRRAGWRTGGLLTLVCCFAPVAWFVVVALLALLLGAGFVLLGSEVAGRRDAWLPPVVAVLLAPVLLAPWWAAALAHGAAGAVVLDAGRLPMPDTGPLDVLAGRVGDFGAPNWAGFVVLALAVLALLPATTRVAVALCWSVALLAVGVAVVLATVGVHTVAGVSPAGLGFPVVVVQGAWVTAILVGGTGLPRGATGRLRVGVVAAALSAAVVPVVGLVWFATSDGQLTSAQPEVVPRYMEQTSVTGPEHGILVVSGDVGSGLRYVVRRDDGVTIGEDEILSLSQPGAEESRVLSALLSRPTEDVVEQARGLGIELVLLSAPADGSVAASLDATSGLVVASAEPGARAWRLASSSEPGALDGPGSPWRVVLLVVQGIGILLVLVLAAPSVRAARRVEEVPA